MANKKKTEKEKINFDLSILSLEELIEVYGEITDFLGFLDEKRILPEKKVEEDE